MGHDGPPQHQVVANDLRRRLTSGEWTAGEKLPSRARLAQEYGVGPNVLQKAQERLIIEGLLKGRAGSGTYVAKPRQRQRMIRFRGGSPFRDDMAELGRTNTEARSHARIPAPADIARRLGIDPGDLCVQTTYKFLADSQPAQLSVSWEPMAITGETPIVLPEMGPLAGRGVVERMRSIGVDITTAVEVLRPSRPTQKQVNLLGINLGDLVLVIERTYLDAHGRAVETADITVPDSCWDVVYEFGIDPPQ
jgi:GntR family transcriptional regulator